MRQKSERYQGAAERTIKDIENSEAALFGHITGYADASAGAPALGLHS